MEILGKDRAISSCQKTYGRGTGPEELWEIYFLGFLILILFTGMLLRIIRGFKSGCKNFFFFLKI